MKRVEVVATMGTVVSVDVRTPTTTERFDQALAVVSHRLRAIDDQLSPWRRDSWVSALISGVLAATDCPVEVQHVVSLAEELMEPTGGYFSPYWRRLPYGDPGPDPTGLVKGWAAQQASDVLIAHGLPDHVVNAAGDVVVSGRSAPADPRSTWRVGISDPHEARSLAGAVELDQTAARWAVATSGTAELGAHVTDPHNGRFPRGVASATAVVRLDSTTDGAAVADACATALVAAGDAAPALLDRLRAHAVAAVLIGRDAGVCDPNDLLVPAGAGSKTAPRTLDQGVHDRFERRRST